MLRYSTSRLDLVISFFAREWGDSLYSFHMLCMYCVTSLSTGIGVFYLIRSRALGMKQVGWWVIYS